MSVYAKTEAEERAEYRNDLRRWCDETAAKIRAEYKTLAAAIEEGREAEAGDAAEELARLHAELAEVAATLPNVR